MPQTPPKEFYRQQIEKRGNPPLGEWGRMALEHWKANENAVFKGLMREGTLNQAAILAQEKAKDLYASLVENGMDGEAAREMALAEYVLTPPSETRLPEDRIEGQNNERAALNDLLASDPSRPTPRRMPETSSSETPPPSTPED